MLDDELFGAGVPSESLSVKNSDCVLVAHDQGVKGEIAVELFDPAERNVMDQILLEV